jgi:hypothetical protein
VYINPVTIGKVKWEQYRLLTESKLRSAQPVTVLVRPPVCPVLSFFSFSYFASQLVPLSRHSPLNELRAFVSLFRPARVVPNTLDPSLHGLDALCIPNIFAGCLSNPQPPSSSAFADALDDDLEITEDGGDSALQNLVGDDAERIARTWADSGRGVEKLAIVEQFLTGHNTARHAVRRVLGLAPLPPRDAGVERAVSMLQRIRDKQRIQVCRGGQSSSVGESDQETERDDEDAHSRTARMLFGLTGGSVESQSQSQEEGPGTVPASRVPTPPVSECGSSRHVTHSETRFAEPGPPSPSSRLIAPHASSPPSLTSPIRSTFGRGGDSPQVGLKNTPLTLRTKRQHPWSQSLSHSQSPPTIHLHTLKRRKLSAADEPAPAGNFTAARLNTGPPGNRWLKQSTSPPLG